MKKKNEKHYESNSDKVRRHIAEGEAAFARSFQMIGRTSAAQCKETAASHLLTAVAELRISAAKEHSGAWWRPGVISNEPRRFRIWHEYDANGKPLDKPHFGEWCVESDRDKGANS